MKDIFVLLGPSVRWITPKKLRMDSGEIL